MTSIELKRLGNGCDLLIPALEDLPVLERLDRASRGGILPPMLFDLSAYRLSSSKIRSKRLFARLGLPAAEDWRPGGPDGAFVAKPDGSSGSRGVRFFKNSAEAAERFPTVASRRGWVVERELDGPSYSVEVTARRGQAVAWQVTALEMDEDCDCRAVVAPSGLPPEKDEELGKMAVRLAESLKLTGLMDLEAVLENGKFKLLEIDARFPSQTPTAVYWSSGVNLLEELARAGPEGRSGPKSPLARRGEGKNFVSRPPRVSTRKVRYEHALWRDGIFSAHGEGLMARMGPVVLMENFMGAKEALVTGRPEGRFVAATLIHVEEPA
jgi:pyrrolysine biosynthesis protein PylC